MLNIFFIKFCYSGRKNITMNYKTKKLILTLLSIFGIFINNISTTPTQDVFLEQTGEYLIPTDILPLEYDIHLIPYLEAQANISSFTFEGWMTTLFQTVGATTILRMHAGKNLRINKLKHAIQGVYEKNPREIVGTYTSVDDKEFYDIYLSTSLYEGSDYNLNISFKGEITDDMFGFYRSSYDENGLKKYLATTFFEATGARRVFPCFDEPKWKAKVTLHVAHSPQHHVISNMPTLGDETPVEENPNLEGWMWTHFQQSVKMSTYLIAFTISEFSNTSLPEDSRYKIYTRPGAESQGDYANILAPKIINFMEKYTNHTYSLPKIDQIALPDFVAGAMENWGLITYRETSLLYQEGVSAATNKQRVATVVAHELAHQWFGNLVSPKWWNNMWLNEGFATYYQYRSLATIETDWLLEQQFVQVEMHVALQTDSQETIHPLIEVVENPGGSNPILEDRLVYVKGGSILRMMANFLEESNFQIGINNYLTDRAFNNADSDDLWRTMQVAVQPGHVPEDIEFRDVMLTWAKQPGYPVITLTRNYSTETPKAIAMQERFVMIGSLETSHEEIWMIPITITTAENPNFKDVNTTMWLTEKQIEIDLSANIDQWVMLNIKQVGFYRVNYDNENWYLLISALKDHTKMLTIDPINRGQLMDDALALARAKRLDYNTALDTTEYLSHEIEYMPWATALTGFSYLYDRLNYEEQSRDLFEWYVLSKIDAVYTSVNGLNVADQDSHITRIKRSIILNWACKLGHEECNKEAKTMFSKWKTSLNPEEDNPIAPDVKSVIYCAGMRNGNADDFDFLMIRFINAFNVATEQAFILESLACASQPELLWRLLHASITEDSGIRPQDAKAVFASVYNNRIGVDVALDFLMENYNISSTSYGGMGSIGGLFSGLATKLNTEEQRNKLQTFRDDNEEYLGAALAGIDSGLVTLNQTLAWHVDQGDDVVSYFATKRSQKGSASTVSPCFFTFLSILLINQL